MEAIQIGVSSTLAGVIEKGLVSQSIDEILGDVVNSLILLRRLHAAGATPAEIVHSIYTAVDSAMARHNVEQPVSCKKGCAFCCKMNVDVTPFEAMVILCFVRKHAIAINLEYLQAQAKIPKGMLTFTPGLSACVFLQQDNTCGIYPVRPLACRKYVVKNPPEKCDGEKYPNGMQDVLIDVDIEILVSALDNFQNGQIDSLHKTLLCLLSQEQ